MRALSLALVALAAGLPLAAWIAPADTPSAPAPIANKIALRAVPRVTHYVRTPAPLPADEWYIQRRF